MKGLDVRRGRAENQQRPDACPPSPMPLPWPDRAERSSCLKEPSCSSSSTMAPSGGRGRNSAERVPMTRQGSLRAARRRKVRSPAAAGSGSRDRRKWARPGKTLFGVSAQFEGDGHFRGENKRGTAPFEAGVGEFQIHGRLAASRDAEKKMREGPLFSAGKGVHLRAVFPERGQLFLRELEGRLWRRQQRFLWFRLVLFGRGGAKFHQLVLHQCRERLRAVGAGLRAAFCASPCRSLSSQSSSSRCFTALGRTGHGGSQASAQQFSVGGVFGQHENFGPAVREVLRQGGAFGGGHGGECRAGAKSLGFCPLPFTSGRYCRTRMRAVTLSPCGRRLPSTRPGEGILTRGELFQRFPCSRAEAAASVPEATSGGAA